jgi:hypothetical protein
MTLKERICDWLVGLVLKLADWCSEEPEGEKKFMIDGEPVEKN